MAKKDDEFAIDFSRIANFFSSKGAHKEKKAHSQAKHEVQDDPEGQTQEEHHHAEHSTEPAHHSHKKESEGGFELAFDISNVWKMMQKYSVLFLVLFPLILAFFVRVHSIDLPQTDDWARNSVNTYFRNQMVQQVNQLYPNLPAVEKEKILNEQIAKYISEHEDEYEQTVEQVSQQFKSSYKYEENGKSFTYMPDIDPYYYLRFARNIVKTGHIGDEVREGKEFDNHILAPKGDYIRSWLLPYMMVYLYWFMQFFSGSITLMQAAGYLSAIVAALCVIPAFFLGKRIAGNVSGFFAAVMIALNLGLLTRTSWGHPDTDAFNVLLPLLILWLVVEAFYARKEWLQYSLAGISGLIIGIFSYMWYGWWYIFDFILIMICFFLVYIAMKKSISLSSLVGVIDKNVRSILIILVIFVVSSFIFVSLLTSPKSFSGVITEPINSLSLKSATTTSSLWPNVYTTVAELNEASLSSIVDTLGGGAISAGGKPVRLDKFIFFIGMLGLILLIVRGRKSSSKDWMFITGSALWYFVLLSDKMLAVGPVTYSVFISIPVLIGIALSLRSGVENDSGSEDEERFSSLNYAVILFIWIAAMTFASTKGVRFTLLMVPPFSLMFGATMGVAHEKLTNALSSWFSRSSTTAIIVAVLLALVLIPTYKSALLVGKSDIPIVNDAWVATYDKIRLNSSSDAIINSWWDFGHHFKYFIDRRVTFDGAVQNRAQAHWIGRALLTENEKEAVGILRMLDCGANDAFEVLENATDDVHGSVDMIYKVIVLDKEASRKELEKKIDPETTEKVLRLTHCNPPEDYFITSEDMVGKSGVWAHFGSWDFERAEIWSELRKKDVSTAVSIMQQKFNYSQSKAENVYYEAQGILSEKEGNNWIAPWPSYGSATGCSQAAKDLLVCAFNLGANQPQVPFNINLSTMDAFVETSQGRMHPKALSYIKGNDTFVIRRYTNSTIDYGLSLIPSSDGASALLMSPQLVGSMFTRTFYYGGIGLKHFKQFDYQRDVTGLRIITWKIDWEGSE
ncbi:MAG TPA: STT3 domain-containing protein [Candidatus Nanoarchaeia archaeon]|nr:STT3 domain-containing protein [Candidatus Nanoarchaeia archaeon]